jgi:hypothetical protein
MELSFGPATQPLAGLLAKPDKPQARLFVTITSTVRNHSIRPLVWKNSWLADLKNCKNCDSLVVP